MTFPKTLTAGNGIDVTEQATTITVAVEPGIFDHLGDTVDAHDASAISVLNTNGYFTTDPTVEAALVGLLTDFMPSMELPPDSGSSVPRLDIFPTELASGTQALTTARQTMVYFTVQREITVNAVDFAVHTTASAGLTIGAQGLCFLDEDGHVYPAAKCANDTALFGVVSTINSKAFNFGSGWPTAVTLVPGRYYAATTLCIGTTMPVLISGPAVLTALQGQSRSRRTGVVTGFLDFQQRTNMGGLTNNTPWCRVLAGGTTNRARSAVLLGDSFLAFNGYPDWIARGNAQGGSRLHFIRNKGTSGDTLANCVTRFATDVAAYNPEWCVVHAGVNDIFTTGSSAATITALYDQLIAAAQAAGIKLLICVPPSHNPSTAGTRTILGEVRSYLLALSEAGVTVVDTGTVLTTGDGVTADAAKLVDTVHPNATGITALADAVDSAIAAIT